MNTLLGITLDKESLKKICWLTLWRLTPRIQLKNPTQSITYFGAIYTLLYGFTQYEQRPQDAIFMLSASFWLWLAVIFGNLSQVIAAYAGKERGRALRKAQLEIFTNRIVHGQLVLTSSVDLKKGDIILCETGDIIPADGEVLEGAAMVDESAITGESAPVMRESGGFNSSISAGTKILKDRLTIRVLSDQGKNSLDRIIELVSGEERKTTRHEKTLQVVLMGISALLLIVILTTQIFIYFTQSLSGEISHKLLSPSMLFVIFLCMVPTAIGALSDSIIIAGVDRLFQKGIITKSEQWLESIADADLVVMDKTGTLTVGNRQAESFYPILGLDERIFAHTAMLASLSDMTPEGRSIVRLAKSQYGLWEDPKSLKNCTIISYSPESRISGIDFTDEKGKIRQIRKGSVDVIKSYVEELGGGYYTQIDGIVKSIAYQGATPLLVCDGIQITGVIKLKDILKEGVRNCCEELRLMGIKTLMVTGDNPLTAASIAAECSVDDFVGETTPEIKLDIIKNEQRKGFFVVMLGDGNDDAPSLAQADIGVTMNTGTQTSRDAGNMVDLDSNPIKIVEIIRTAKEILITRGIIGMCSLSGCLVKYAAIFPLFIATASLYGIDQKQNSTFLGFDTIEKALLSSLALNFLTIIALFPTALKGIRIHKPQNSSCTIFRRHIFRYGIGSLIFSAAILKLISFI